MNRVLSSASWFGLALLAWACTRGDGPQGSRSRVKDETIRHNAVLPISEISDLTCEAGAKFYWVSLNDVQWSRYEPGPGGDHVDVSRNVFVKSFDVNPATWDPTSPRQVRAEDNARFDFCTRSDGTSSLKRIVLGIADLRARVLDVDVPNAKILGAESLAFLESGSLSMEIPLSDSEVFLLLPFSPQRPIPQGAIFFGIGKRQPDGRVKPTNGKVVVGSLQNEVNPFGECAAFGVPGAFLKQSLTVDELSIEASLCVGRVGGDSFSYKVVGVKAAHPRMTEISGGRILNNVFEAKGDAASRVWKEKLTHHSTCDQFVLKIPDFGVVGVTAAPYARADPLDGCEYFREAPRLGENGQKARFLVKYANSVVREGDLPNRFYFDEEALGRIVD